MKRTALIAVILASTLAGAVLTGERYGLQAKAQEGAEATDTNLVSSVETNFPPVNSLLDSALPPEIDPASPFGQLVRLIQAGVEKSVILAYIQNSPRFYELSADDIIYLNDLGTPSEIIEAVLAHDQQLFDEGTQSGEQQAAEQTEVIEEDPPEVSLNDLDETLSPYGTWVHIDGYGRCWRPTVAVYNTGWRPYCDNGRWVYTDRGWYWMSNYSWGWATFHYGRWFRHTHYGWCWWPDTVWAPSWVCWRYDNDYCGWAPLPPYTVYRSGVGLVYRGSTVHVGFHFNLTHDCYTFVSVRNFCNPYPRRYCVDRDRVRHIYKQSKIDCRYDIDRNRKTIINKGLPVQHVSTASRQKITPRTIRYSPANIGQGSGFETLSRDRSSVVVRRNGYTTTVRPSNPRPRTVTRPNSSVKTTRPQPSVKTRSSSSTSRSSVQGRQPTKMDPKPQVKPNSSVTPTRPSVTRPKTGTSGSSSVQSRQPATVNPKPQVKPKSPVKPTPPSVTRPKPRTSTSVQTRQPTRVTPKPQVKPRSPAVKPVRPTASRPNSSSTVSQRSRQVRTQRPTVPASSSRYTQAQKSRPSSQPQVQPAPSQPKSASKVSRSRTPSPPRRPAAPSQSKNKKSMEKKR